MRSITWKTLFLCLFWLSISALTFAACDDDAGSGTTPTEDTGSDVVEDTNPTTRPDTTPNDTGVDTTPDPCAACGATEICVRNNTVTDICFAVDCSTQDCADGEVCDPASDSCVSEACAGVACGSGEICLAGTCATASCASGNVTCPNGEVCDPVTDACVTACGQQSDCDPLACAGGLCVPCDDTRTCGGALVCDGGQCATSCNDDPTTCNSTEACDPNTGLCITSCNTDPTACTTGDVCDPDTGLCATDCSTDPTACGTGEVCEASSGLCVPPCTSDSTCAANGQICEFSTGLCVAPECTVNGTQAECAATDICLDGRCEILNPRFTGGLSSGGATSTGANHTLIGIVGPASIVGPGAASSTNFNAQFGPVVWTPVAP